jgi:nucleoside-diphosphate-sugar epimerase
VVRVFLAGATGVLGVRLLPLLVAAGHQVAGMTRRAEKADLVRELGAEPVVCDVFDSPHLNEAVTSFRSEMVMHQLTDLPDDADRLEEYSDRNDRMRTVGTRNLLTAAGAAGAKRFLAQSIAWRLPPGRQKSTDTHERQVLYAGGVVIRYGQLYGPGTYYEDTLPSHPRIHVDEAARRTVRLLGVETGVVVLEDRRN